MAKLTIKWEIEDSDGRADKETGTLLTVSGTREYVDDILNTLVNRVKPFKKKND